MKEKMKRDALLSSRRRLFIENLIYNKEPLTQTFHDG